jgi:hypothetical protein
MCVSTPGLQGLTRGSRLNIGGRGATAAPGSHQGDTFVFHAGNALDEIQGFARRTRHGRDRDLKGFRFANSNGTLLCFGRERFAAHCPELTFEVYVLVSAKLDGTLLMKEELMTRLAYAAMTLVLGTALAHAQAPTTPAPAAGPAPQALTTVPSGANTITHWYKENVYDPGDNKIGEVRDVLLDREGKVTAFIVGVGGFLGIGEKDVAVPFNAIRFTEKNNNKWYMVMNTTKDAMKAAPGFKYDRTSMTWMPEGGPTTGGPAPTPR